LIKVGNNFSVMLKKFKKFTLQMIGGANVASIVIMLLIGYSGFINPERFPKLSNIGLIFPLFWGNIWNHRKEWLWQVNLFECDDRAFGKGKM